MGLQLDLGFMTSGLTKFLIELMPIKRRKEKVLFFRGNIACFCHLEIRLKCPVITLFISKMLGLVKEGLPRQWTHEETGPAGGLDGCSLKLSIDIQNLI